MKKNGLGKHVTVESHESIHTMIITIVSLFRDIATQFADMNKEEFTHQIEQTLIEDIERQKIGANKFASLMDDMPRIPYKDMAPLFRIICLCELPKRERYFNTISLNLQWSI